jgi:hemerythrin-like metal-binding protein
MSNLFDPDKPKLTTPHNNTVILNIPIIDNQHQELVDLLNQTSYLVFNKTEESTVIKLLNELIEKTVVHFSTEEELIHKHCSKEDADIHILQHIEAISTLVALKNKLELDLLTYQLKYKSGISHFMETLFSQDLKLANKLNGISTKSLPTTGNTSIDIP